jgi:hypothetical protein
MVDALDTSCAGGAGSSALCRILQSYVVGIGPRVGQSIRRSSPIAEAIPMDSELIGINYLAEGGEINLPFVLFSGARAKSQLQAKPPNCTRVLRCSPFHTISREKTTARRTPSRPTENFSTNRIAAILAIQVGSGYHRHICHPSGQRYLDPGRTGTQRSNYAAQLCHRSHRRLPVGGSPVFE